MKGRASLPGADELFRVTSIEKGRGRGAKQPATEAQQDDREPAERVPSGRQRHDEKVTFYCTAEELIDLEDARILLRREHGVAVDRGRIVREALAQVLSELERDGAEAPLVKRLHQMTGGAAMRGGVRAVDLIARKRDGGEIAGDELRDSCSPTPARSCPTTRWPRS